MFQYDYHKVQIVQAAQALVQKGYLMATGGNLSVRISGQNAFAITPSNYDYLKMTSNDICVLDFKLNILQGDLKPSVEAEFHAAVYQARGDVNAVVHTHQVYVSALALIGAEIPGLFDEQVRYLGRNVKIIPYAPSGTGMLAGKIKRSVRDHNNAYIMANHGALCFGESMERAVNNIEILEKCSLAYLLTLCADKKANHIPSAVREIAFAKLRKDQKRLASGEQAQGGE